MKIVLKRNFPQTVLASYSFIPFQLFFKIPFSCFISWWSSSKCCRFLVSKASILTSISTRYLLALSSCSYILNDFLNILKYGGQLTCSGPLLDNSITVITTLQNVKRRHMVVKVVIGRILTAFSVFQCCTYMFFKSRDNGQGNAPLFQ